MSAPTQTHKKPAASRSKVKTKTSGRGPAAGGPRPAHKKAAPKAVAKRPTAPLEVVEVSLPEHIQQVLMKALKANTPQEAVDKALALNALSLKPKK